MAKKTTKQAFTPGDIRRIRFVSDPMVHPDGDRVAYVVRTVDKNRGENRYRAEIWLTDPAGRRRRLLTASGMDSDAPLWSPDGWYLLFLGLEVWALVGYLDRREVIERSQVVA